MRTHLLMAIIGLLLGLAMLFPRLVGWEAQFRNDSTRTLGGCIILLIACYNFARWYGWISFQRRQADEEDFQRLRKRSTGEQKPEEDNPDFDFSDKKDA